MKSSIIATLLVTIGLTPLLPRSVIGGEISRSEDVQRAANWFNELGFPNTSGRQFVHLTIRELNRDPTDGRVVKMYGFILTQYQNRYAIFTDDLRVVEVAITSDDPKDSLFSVESASFEEYAKGVLEMPESYWPQVWQGFCWEMGSEFGSFRTSLELPRFARYFVLSWMSSQNDMHDLAQQLTEQAMTTKLDLLKEDTLSAELKYALCVAFTDRAIAMLADSNRSRVDVKAKLSWIVERFPDQSSRAKQILAIVSQMVEEDEARSRELAVLGQTVMSAEELVYYLRDQPGWDMNDEQFYGYDGTVPGFKTPAEQLLEMGEAAVPVLIEAVGDQRLTRMVAQRGLGDSPGPQRVRSVSIGWCAVNLLASIFGEIPPGVSAREAENPEEAATAREILRTYWNNKSQERKDQP